MFGSSTDDHLNSLERGSHHFPQAFLGYHSVGEQSVVRLWRPKQLSLSVRCRGEIHHLISRPDLMGLFEWDCSAIDFISPFEYQVCLPDGRWILDPYSFHATFSDLDAYLFGKGVHYDLFEKLGAHLCCLEGTQGVLFSVWAPRADGVSVVGDFSSWEIGIFPMAKHPSGVWILFIPGLHEGEKYKFAITSHKQVYLKSDPFGFQFEIRPDTASIINNRWKNYCWSDQSWMESRKQTHYKNRPLSIYEVHLGSWKRLPSGKFCSYERLAKDLGSYVLNLGFTHIELLPVCEHPLDESWGYQTTGYFSPTSRFGTIEDFQRFVDVLHQMGIGVILDWVPAHFASDTHGLANFDGFPLYEDADPLRQVHPHWGTRQFDYGRPEVSNFLLASALFWLNILHVDGLRVDAVSSMLYRDYGRQYESWSPNRHGGKENLETIEFLKHLNSVVHLRAPGALTLAEESTDWSKMTWPLDQGGLGFDFKWNMGWMHDTLRYFGLDPYFRGSNKKDISFALFYAYMESFLLPLSHDEVVHCKGSFLGKMFGDLSERFSHLRLLYSYQVCMPGKKLLFMGSEWGVSQEWSATRALNWGEKKKKNHASLWRYVRDLYSLYSRSPALWEWDHFRLGFEWVDVDEREKGLFIYLRKSSDQTLFCIHNFTPIAQDDYTLPFFAEAQLSLLFNSENPNYGGTVMDEDISFELAHSLLSVFVPPYSTLVFEVSFGSRTAPKRV
ncbi:1,4-alpha-glucan branching protein GlgB [Candidatus Similichlamydia laticola]|uniref:1,4-alpha-glucan branching protein GlgB n=1 Tax=Candidatus Similichlamydia laticola TaxID=2170265 RepID=UPI0015F04611|nr:1,4-alpha-glucan branching protein GlgB [Candidatus Similichlamydia laticola]